MRVLIYHHAMQWCGVGGEVRRVREDELTKLLVLSKRENCENLDEEQVRNMFRSTYYDKGGRERNHLVEDISDFLFSLDTIRRRVPSKSNYLL